LFRALAVLIGFSPFLIVEGALQWSGWEPQPPGDDPYVEFHAVRPLFTPTEDKTEFHTAEDRLIYFRPQSFAAEKPSKEFRIFVLGGSTVQGRPYAVETSFTNWLEISLQAADPTRSWKVVNCGGVSYASYRLAPIMEEVLDYEPDLIILYSGHNEFLEDRSYHFVKQSPTVSRTYLSLSNLRSFALCQQLLEGDSETQDEKVELSTEVDAMLDYQNGLEPYHRDSEWRRDVISHFEHNVRRMVAMAQAAKTPILMIDPPCNMKDCPPFKMVDSEGLSPAQKERCQRLWETAKSEPDNAQAILLLQEALAINPQQAGLHFHLGKLYEAQQEFVMADKHFVRAKEEDICPLRILEPMRVSLARVAQGQHAPLLDLRQTFRDRTSNGLLGDELFIDHVHPTVRGHQLIAEDLMDQLQTMGIVSPEPGWQVFRDDRYQQVLKELDLVYFERGQQRLEGLRRWTQGRARKIKGQPSD